MNLRKATILDATQIQHLIASFAGKRVMLPRSLNFVYENIRDFWVAEDQGMVVGCAALHVVGWQDLAEIKSLSVSSDYQKSGLGKKLVDKCIQEAKPLGVKRIFALTFVPDFFKRCDFSVIDREDLPHKIWTDCIDCPFFDNCKEIAVQLDLE